jgi:hypothetical protein
MLPRTIPVLLLAALAGPAMADRMAAPEGAAVYFITPDDGAMVTSPVTVVFGLRGMGIAPAGTEKENTGHHHLLIDIEPDALDLNEALPADDNVKHFGGGQTETSVELAPGPHTLRLLLGDMNHVPFDPPVISEEITVTVE